MARREKFDRSDVPEASPLRTVMALFALVVVAVLTVLLVRTVWKRAHLDDRLNDAALNSCLRTQYATQYWDWGVGDDDLNVVLVITVDGDVTSPESGLSALSLVVVNHTDGTGTVVDIPVDTRMTSSGVKYTAASAWSALGEAKFIEVVSWFTNVPADHIIVASRDVLGDLEGIRKFGPINTITSRLLESIRTDMRQKTLLTFAGEISSIGLDNFTYMEVPRWHEDPAEGDEGVPEGGWEIIHRTDLCRDLGIFVDPSSEEEPGE